MRNHRNQSKVFAMIVLGTIVTAAALPARWVQAAVDGEGGSLARRTSGMVGIVPGQTARIGIVNTGREEVQITLALLDEEGKVQIQCDAIVARGKAYFEDFTHPGGANRLELRGVVIVREAAARKAEAVVPSLQIFDNDTGKTIVTYGGNDFVAFRPVTSPPV